MCKSLPHPLKAPENTIKTKYWHQLVSIDIIFLFFLLQFKAILLQVLVLDMLACLVVDRILQFICGTATLRTK